MATRPLRVTGLWFDHALVLVLLAGALTDVWLGAYLLLRALGQS